MVSWLLELQVWYLCCLFLLVSGLERIGKSKGRKGNNSRNGKVEGGGWKVILGQESKRADRGAVLPNGPNGYKIG